MLFAVIKIVPCVFFAFCIGRLSELNDTDGVQYKDKWASVLFVCNLVGVAYVAVSNLAPGLSMFVFLVYFLAGPWLIVRSLRFKAVVTTWSGVRFRFEGEYGRAFKVFALYPILVAISLYLILPFLSRAIKRYIINGHSLGGSHFSFDTEIGPFYRAFLWAILGSIVCAALGFAIATIIATLAKSLPEKWLSDISRL